MRGCAGRHRCLLRFARIEMGRASSRRARGVRRRRLGCEGSGSNRLGEFGVGEMGLKGQIEQAAKALRRDH